MILKKLFNTFFMTNIKKKQAILIGNGDLNITNLIDIVLDGAIEKVQYFDKIKPQVLLGDFDRGFVIETWKEKYPDLQIIHAPDQEKTDFEKAIEYLIENKFTSIIALGITGKRMDHTFNNISSLAKYNQLIDIKIIDPHSIIYCIDEQNVYVKRFEKDSIISLLPIGTVKGISTENLVYNLTNEDLELGVRTGSSNAVLETGEVKITIKKGKLLVMECND